MGDRESIDIIVISEQLELIDFIEKTLKKSHVVNTHQANQVVDVKRILSHESIEIIIIDDAEGTLGTGSISSAVKELRLTTPVLQLRSANSDKAFGDFLKNGAALVCPNNDAQALLSGTDLLLSYNDSLAKVERGSGEADDYRHKFDDLYQGLADPVCYLTDGVFVDCNPAFLRAFEISDKEELQELTIMQLVDRKSQGDLKKHLKRSALRDLSASPVVFQMLTKLGNEAEYVIMSKPAKFNNEDVVQMYMRSTSESGGAGGAGLYDETTGLANKEQMGFFLKQKIEEFGSRGGQGVLVYILIRNYRDVWGTDGLDEAEKFILATTKFVRENSPAHTEISRYTDDGLLLFIPNIAIKEAETSLVALVRGLDAVTPDGMERMVEPLCFVGFDEINKESDYLALIGQLFRTARNSAISGGARTGRPTATEVAQKDKKRLDILQSVLSDERIKLFYQPIASFQKSDVECYRERIKCYDQEGEKLELDVLMSVAERYELTHRLDRWKINHLFNKLLEAGKDERKTVVVFIAISVDSLKKPAFISWLVEQMQHTGLGGRYFVFEMAVDNVQNAYSGAKQFAQAMRENGARIAVTKLGSLSKDNSRIIDDIQPEFIKLDLREIDTLDDTEEKEVMGDIVSKAQEHQSTLIAEYIESPAQLARVWPYGVQLIQGDAMTPLLEDMDFDFGQFDLS